MRSACKNTANEGFSFHPAALVTAHFPSPSAKRVGRSQIASECWLHPRVKTMHTGDFLWASFIDLVSSHTKPSSGERFEQKVSYHVFPPTDRVPMERLPGHLPSLQNSPLPWVQLHFCHGAPVRVHLAPRMYPNGQVVANGKEIHSLLHIMSKSSMRCGALLFLPGM